MPAARFRRFASIVASSSRVTSVILATLFVGGCGATAVVPGLGPSEPEESPVVEPVRRILFGSCLRQNEPAPILSTLVRESEPVADLLILAGDNVYADTESLEAFQEAYRTLTARPEYQALASRSEILATWDDHDYGVNDGGADFAAKRVSKSAFLEVFGREDDPREKRAGVYDHRAFGPEGRRVQVILLDTRWFRSPLTRQPERPKGRGPYMPSPEEAEQQMLGEAQWAWLGRTLREPAALRIIVSSVQFLADEHGWECWGNLPKERQRMLDLLRESGAGGVVFISGDRHHGEISVWDMESEPEPSPTGRPVVDVTSSSLNAGRGEVTEPNRFRRGRPYGQPNFGRILIDWEATDPTLTIELCDVDGSPIRSHRVRKSELE